MLPSQERFGVPVENLRAANKWAEKLNPEGFQCYDF